MSRSPAAERRRPGRPAQFDREHILDDLLMLFWRKGYEAATQEEMLTATRVSSSTLYRSFGNKADILRTVLERYVDSAASMLAPLEDGHEGTADVHAFLDHVEALITGPMGSAGCLAVETMQAPINRDARVRSLTDRHLQRMRRGLTKALRRAVEARELPQSTPPGLADAIQAGVLGALARARCGDTTHAAALLGGVRSLLPERRK
jgi:TetR/AcrR family transcriptional regulator, transcriptional repressor for nem operon